MKTPCIKCARFSLQRAPKEEARKGYGRCLAQPVDVLLHIDRDVRCRDFKPASDDQVESRRVWWMQHTSK
jgi:hypothetical protein